MGCRPSRNAVRAERNDEHDVDEVGVAHSDHSNEQTHAQQQPVVQTTVATHTSERSSVLRARDRLSRRLASGTRPLPHHNDELAGTAKRAAEPSTETAVVAVAREDAYNGYPSTARAAQSAKASGYAVDLSVLSHTPVHTDDPSSSKSDMAQPHTDVATTSSDTDVTHECPVCLDTISVDDSAMRCAGEGGVEHYFHARCLSQWTRTQRTQLETPSCPICRG